MTTNTTIKGSPAATMGTYTDALARLRSVAGHVSGIARMVENDAYCIDVVRQIQAVQAALTKVSVQILDRHLHHCLTEAVRGDDADRREQALTEIRDLFQTREIR